MLIHDALEPQTRMKLKYSTVQHQDTDSNTCGLFALNFLFNRYRGQSFKLASAFYEIELEKRYKEKFEFI